MFRNAVLKGRLVLFTGAALAALVTWGALRADLLVNQGFANAFGAQAGHEVAAAEQSRSQGIASRGGEGGLWLTRAEVESPALFDKGLSVGDRITITGRDGRTRRLEVIELTAIGEPLVPTVAGAPMRLLLVTCRIVGAENDPESKIPVRFIVEGADPAEPATRPPVAAPKA